METKMDPLRQNILEAVECLRLRKCRPDRESIAHYVLRKFGSTMNEIFAELENIVDEGGLIKVEYKSTTSYRNPESFDTKNSPLLTKHSKILNSSKTTRLIVSAINELLVKDPNYTQCGVPLDELREKLVEFDSSRFTEESMHIVLEREISCGGIHMGKSNYLPDSFRVFPKDLPIPDDMQAIISLNADNNAVEVKEKVKKPRKSNNNTDPSSGGVKKARKSLLLVKPELEDIEDESAEDHQQLDEDDELQGYNDDDGEMKPLSRKGTKLTSLGRKIVAEKVAEAVRKSYESTAEFETTSAQMFKLAQNVVNKQVEQQTFQESVVETVEEIVETIEIEIPKGPSLVLASSIDHSSIEEFHTTSTEDNNLPSTTTTPTNGEDTFTEEKEHEAMKSDDLPAPARKRRGRPSTKHVDNNGIAPNTTTTTSPLTTDKKSEDEQVNQQTTPQPNKTKNKSPLPKSDPGPPVTRSKREKRKKEVFDPSPTVVNKKARLSETLSNKKCNKSPPPPPASIGKRYGRKSVPAPNKKDVEELSITPTTSVPNIGKRNLKRKRNSTNSSSSKNKMDSTSVSDGSNEKEVEDEDKNNTDQEISLPIISSSSPPVAETKPVTLICSLSTCQSTKKCEDDAKEEDFLSCSSCHSNFHWECLNFSKELANRIKESATSRHMGWQCFECKCCGTCQEKITTERSDETTLGETDKKSSSTEIVLCESCNVGFHIKCTGESCLEKTNENLSPWTCSVCKEEDKKEISRKSDTSSSTTKSTSGRTQRSLKQKTEKISPELSQVKVNNNPHDDSIMDCEESSTIALLADTDDDDEATMHLFPDDLRLWSKEDVEKYFVHKGLKEEAANLLRQEVDGYSLLLLQRSDIVNGMGFRLGPALKVYRLIHELQVKAPIQPHSSWETETENID